MASTLTVDNIVGATSSSNIHIPGHVVTMYHHNIDPGSQSTASTTLVATGLTITLTPKSNTSRFILFASMHECYVSASANAIGFAIAKNGSRLFDTDGGTLGYHSSGGSNYFNVNLQAYDEPATTSSITYSVLVKSAYGQSVGWCGDNTPAFFTVMEIAQ
jgi:hypothetical protein